MRMKRRTFIVSAGLVFAATVSRSAPAQQTKIPRIGFLGAADPSVAGPWISAFETRLRELGWVDGRTIQIEYRWSEGRTESNAEAAADFVRRKVDVIVSFGGATLAMKQATSVIPIVFTVDADPVGRGPGRVGGDFTGCLQRAVEGCGQP